MKAVRIHSFGGPEVLQVEDVEVPTSQRFEDLVSGVDVVFDLVGGEPGKVVLEI